jgi:hypothetical protein
LILIKLKKKPTIIDERSRASVGAELTEWDGLA